ncbi:PEP-CTERM motif protein [Pirellulimonas nuda]|uniref:PEP-CTERM motif protein n=1 Tax=Pirellulimonas nuda TaxID=2528009 RepID=A0A518DDV9_9BACT|nr:PEP-CTERM sorting domain-containing protein [Pirellulimonas nuda]QDU89657.1 PEP-CTERM motif protein [Pirellulimonas nuda]
MKTRLLLTSCILGAIVSNTLPIASAIVIADAAGDYVAAAGGNTAIPTALPTGWSYWGSSATSGGTELALEVKIVGNAGNTGFGGAGQFGTPAVLGTHTEDPLNADYQFEIFSDGFDGNPPNVPVGNQGVVGVDLLLHPGPTVDLNGVVIARYTIQAGDLAAGNSATIAGSFRDLAGRNTVVGGNPSESVMVEVLHNGSSLFSATGGETAGTNGYLLQANGTFNLTGISLTVGDTIDFAVNNNGNFTGDETALQATIDVGGGAGAIPGDFNGDSMVNAADYTVWRDNLGANENVLPPGTGDGSGTVDVGDYTTWTNSFGQPAIGAIGSAAVPEPGSLALLLFGSVAACGAARRRRIGAA